MLVTIDSMPILNAKLGLSPEIPTESEIKRVRQTESEIQRERETESEIKRGRETESEI